MAERVGLHPAADTINRVPYCCVWGGVVWAVSWGGLGSGFGFEGFGEGLCQLVGAGGGFVAAADAFEGGDELSGLLTLGECADAFEVAVASADEADAGDTTLFVDVEVNLAGACSRSVVCVVHRDND